MPSRLESIVAAARARAEERRASTNMRTLESQALEHEPRGFRAALRDMAARQPAIIAELKKASPSKGLIRAEFDVAALARELQQAGAAALSVLTEEQFFQGSLENLGQASAATSLPCLRKDFIVEEFQILEARAVAADAILLIVATLSDERLRALKQFAEELNLDVLCEVHDKEELERAVCLGFDVIGVNARNLHTFEVSLQTPFDLAGRIPPHVVRVAESGIESGEDIARLRDAGFQAFLIGESLMRAPHPGDALRELLAGSHQIPEVPAPATARW